MAPPDGGVPQANPKNLTVRVLTRLTVLTLAPTPNRPDRANPSSRHKLFGNADDAFAQTLPKRGLITQSEVRAIALSELDIRPESVVWDVGAGSGSVAIEAAQLANLGMAYAIEPEPADIALIQSNAEAFGVANVRTVAGRAPDVLATLPEPDAVFIGGTGRQVSTVLNAVYDRLSEGGRLVVNVATIDGLARAHETLKKLAGNVQVWNIAIARGIEQMDRVRFEATNPTFLLAVRKVSTSGD